MRLDHVNQTEKSGYSHLFTNAQITEMPNAAIDKNTPIQLPMNILSFHDPSPIYSEKAQMAVKKKKKIRKNEVIMMTYCFFIMAMVLHEGTDSKCETHTMRDQIL